MTKRAVTIFLGIAFLILGWASPVFGISAADRASLNGDSIYYWPGQTGSCVAGGGSVTLTGNDPEQQAFNYFVSQGLNAVQAAAVVGNFVNESHLDPTAIEGGGDSTDPSKADPGGWGIAQWTPGSKTPGIAKSLGITGDIAQLSTQLQIVWAEMTGTAPTGYKNVAGGLKAINDLSSAVTFFQVNFESGVAGMRQKDAQDVYNKYGSTAGNSGSTVSTLDSNNNCSGGTAINCSTNATATNGANAATSGGSSSTTRQDVVCLAQQELALWKAQPNYGAAYPNFAYAKTGYLKYTQNSAEEWCADFVSWIYNQAGYPLQTGSGWRMAAVASIQSMAQNSSRFTYHPESSNYVPQPGDIAIHLANGISHTNIFISSTGGTSTYIGGDQGHGPYPGGSMVSTEQGQGYYDSSLGINGYVSPNN